MMNEPPHKAIYRLSMKIPPAIDAPSDWPIATIQHLRNSFSDTPSDSARLETCGHAVPAIARAQRIFFLWSDRAAYSETQLIEVARLMSAQRPPATLVSTLSALAGLGASYFKELFTHFLSRADDQLLLILGEADRDPHTLDELLTKSGYTQYPVMLAIEHRKGMSIRAPLLWSDALNCSGALLFIFSSSDGLLGKQIVFL